MQLASCEAILEFQLLREALDVLKESQRNTLTIENTGLREHSTLFKGQSDRQQRRQ